MIRFSFAVAVVFVLAGCAAPRMLIPPPSAAALPAVATDAAVGDSVVVAATPDADASTEEGPRPAIERLDPPPRDAAPAAPKDGSTQFSAKNALTVAAEAMPLRNFLTYVLGDLLKVNFVLPSEGLDQPVTLNVQKPVSSRELFRLVADLLAERGLAIKEKQKVFFVLPVSGKSEDGIPIGIGSRPADVPDVPGKILQIIPLRYGANSSIERTVNSLIDVVLYPDFQQGAFFVTGTRAAILKVLDIVSLFDQPSLRSSRVGLVNLTYVSSKEFTDQLIVLLENEGILAGVGSAAGKSVALVPLEQLGAVVVFASTSNLLDRVEFWAKQVDKPGQGLTQRYFIYQPKYARASDLGESLAPLLGGAIPNVAGNLARDTRSALGGNNDPAAITKDTAMRRDNRVGNAAPGVISIQGAEGLTLSIDSRSNSLIFYTTGPRYESLLPMIRRLDVPPKQIVLEATIAEVSLSGDFAQGVEFAFTRNQDVASGSNAFRMTTAAASSAAAADQLNGGTLGRLGLPSSGMALNYIMNATDQVRLRLSSSDSRVNIISNPILVVRDGVGATISVGSDVPTVGATASDPIQSNRVVTTVLYRKTGLTLDITPTINAQGLVVMRIAQTISNTVPGSSDVQGAPVFFERSVSTEVVAGSGQTVLLGGLISESGTNSSAGVPVLSRIPILGSAFRSDQKKKDKTELVLLITPRILESGADWDSVRNGIGRALKYLELPEAIAPTKPVEARPEN